MSAEDPETAAGHAVSVGRSELACRTRSAEAAISGFAVSVARATSAVVSLARDLSDVRATSFIGATVCAGLSLARGAVLAHFTFDGVVWLALP